MLRCSLAVWMNEEIQGICHNEFYRYCSNKTLLFLFKHTCLHAARSNCKEKQQSKWKKTLGFLRRRKLYLLDYRGKSFSIIWNRLKTCLKTEFIIIFLFASHVKHKNDNFFHFKWQVHLDLILDEA